MTLARGNIRGYEDDRMVLLFSMMDGAREVPCAVSASAMDELEHVPRTPAGQREEQFARLRDRIEACASRKFQAREFEAAAVQAVSKWKFKPARKVVSWWPKRRTFRLPMTTSKS